MHKRVAIVTGGGSGIGLAIAEKFTSNGILTVIVGRDENKLNAAKSQLGDLCFPISHDVSNLSTIPVLIEKVIQQFGQIDILVNNAGINMKKDFTTITDEEFQQVITTNLCSVFAISREVVKHMLIKGSGSIINISSMAAQYGIPRVIAYSASKAAVDGMTRAMAVELSPKGIRINSIAPGFIETAMTAVALNTDPERKSKALGRTPMGYLGQPEDVANAALFLASDAAKYITGVILPVDGGNAIGF
ncbi:NAD(P)-dependent dehydrogenase, short-chain alcohol dehydrogenase family [Chitinophaga sp. CF118]|uniref:SDR family NAD(P)-dependent oxidoreductase n=1 Tax=Chitinophaga sp. CF118 TaxID=1884367 RepID=UPI0008E01132|nr:3-oxoacyl-ACP reductase family protein [Chitinophaga sp. CF118]SFF06396.1 NAD(P)-dependent dehydrogenase, short-chain alcohol dehydrogenase family [Chitinophaga sp. CF118]